MRRSSGIPPQSCDSVMSGVVQATSPGEDLWAILSSVYGRLKGASKVLAADANTSPRTAENWLHRKSLPQYETLIELMAASPAVNDAVQQAVARRIATTKTRRAAWRTTYDAALHAVGAAEAGAGGGLDRRAVGGGRRGADTAGVDAISVDRRATR